MLNTIWLDITAGVTNVLTFNYSSQCETDAIDVARLNDIVEKRSLKLQKEFVSSTSKPRTPLEPEIQAVLKSGNFAVYVNRWNYLPVFYIVVCLYLIFSRGLSPAVNLSIMLLSYVFYDLYSGILHVVLDNPEFLDFPVLDKPCLEFQWHHQIPNDGATKSFIGQCCGDLNGTVAAVGSLFVAARYLFDFQSPIIDCLIGWKVLMAFGGQYCHAMSHTPSTKRPALVIFLQNNGFMISAVEHNKHHQDHDSNFCIGSGLMNPVITFMYKNISNKWIWLAALVFTSVMDVPIFNYIIQNCVGADEL